MATELQILYETGVAAITCTLTSLADAASRESTVINNGTNKYDDAIVRLKLNGQAGGTGLVHIWVYAALGDSIYTDGATGSDAAFTTANRKNSVCLGSVQMNGATSVTAIFEGVADLFGGRLPKQWGLIIENASGAALSSTAGDFDLDYLGVYYEVVTT